MFLLIVSFLAGVLTSLAPCVLPLLPVIVGSSLVPGAGTKQDRRKPYIIALSLGLSVILFTLLLKASTALIGIDPHVWLYLSGGIVVVLGLSMLFPNLWVRASAAVGFEAGTNTFLAKANKRSGLTGQVLTGAALGPVFSSCSPVYALVLATVLPVNLALGLTYIVAYALGLSLALLAIALAGQKLVKHLGWTANPSGWFRRIIAIILIIVGLAVAFGFDKKFQTWAIGHLPFDVTRIEEKLLPKNNGTKNQNNKGKETTMQGAVFNIDEPYAAPELRGISQWINSNGENLKDLRGKVVLIDFWTYSCINCQRTQPYLNDWYAKYADKGFVILGIHAPEFAFEKVPANVERAIKEARINYPVGLDNDFSTWKAYENQFWPAKYLIDKDGKVRLTHFGEGNYAETEMAIQQLLKENGAQVTESVKRDGDDAAANRMQSPETYLGYSRAERLANADQFKADETVDYRLSNNLDTHEWSLGGRWQVGTESSRSMADGAKLSFTFSAREVYLVMDGPAGATVNVAVDGMDKPGGADLDSQNRVTLNGARLYKLVKADSFLQDRTLTLTFPAGVTVNAFTFGG